MTFMLVVVAAVLAVLLVLSLGANISMMQEVRKNQRLMRMADMVFSEIVRYMKHGDLALGYLRANNVSRLVDWHRSTNDEWSITDWSNATAGELGEMCNAIKKLRRLEGGIANHGKDPSRAYKTREEAIAAVAEEAADTAIYLDLTCAKLNIDLAAAIVDKFNKVSVEKGFPQRLELSSSPQETVTSELMKTVLERMRS